MLDFCWKLSQESPFICVEKHNAPWGTQFYWDNITYPIVNKTSILFHGKYCSSGYATRKYITLNNAQVAIAECVNITYLSINNQTLPTPYHCNPGVDFCEYRTADGVLQFSLLCDCGLNTTTSGYCPLPEMATMVNYIQAMYPVWQNNLCSTLDRDNLIA